ncbi:MAG TPA: hybrid sensor histidine kinase/response regulator, partial [Verrucomicrobiae bacterium]|nr:hybrid sensor histidine kinase/response regulator [Verrucomicrobiae bacterium]
MPDQTAMLDAAFAEYERPIRISNYKVGCVMAFIFVPAGASLDYFVYRAHVGEFFKARLVCDVFLALLWLALGNKTAIRAYRFLGFMVAFLPMAFISWMIYRTDGANSPYYAGLNLVMLGAAILLRWTFMDSIMVAGFTLVTYLAACLFNNNTYDSRFFFNNVYFLTVTASFIVTGSWFYDRIRFSEFALRYELDKNKQELEESNRKLVELDKLKSRFFANLSHEMRTPLTLLMAPLETLRKRFDDAFDRNARELLETMHGNGMRLLKLINDLLDLVRLESGRMDIKSDPLRVKDFFRGLSSAIRQVAAEKNVQVQTRVDDQVGVILTDRDKLEKILLNLLFNALKFTPSGGRIDLLANRKDGEIVLTVTDTGIGIAEKNLPFVFDRFWQADNSSRRKYQGVGIGLALVKELSEMMGGGVSVTSTEGQGTAFTVRLPYQEAPPQTTDDHDIVPLPASDANAGSGEWLANLYRRAEFFATTGARRSASSPAPVALSGRKPVALIADDEPDMQHFLKTELERDYDVIEAVNGVQALEKVELFLPDVVLLDMMMPEMDGLDV